MRIFLFLTLILFCEEISSQSSTKFEPLISDSTVNLYAFVGRKISLVQFDPNAVMSDADRIQIDPVTGDSSYIVYVADIGFYAQYEVLVSVFNTLKRDTICFTAYDHYGNPKFGEYQIALLYISKNKKKNIYTHVKYQFDAIHRTLDGNWEGENGESLETLFLKKKQSVLIPRGFFKE